MLTTIAPTDWNSTTVKSASRRRPSPVRPAPVHSSSRTEPVRSKPKSKPSTSQQFDPTDDDAPIERRSRHDVDAESDSSDRAPRGAKRRSSKRAIGFEEADDDGSSASVEAVEAVDVDPIWTRGAEWGPDLVRVGAVLLGTLVVAWFIVGSSFTVAFGVFVIGVRSGVFVELPDSGDDRAPGSDDARAGGQRLLRGRRAPSSRTTPGGCGSSSVPTARQHGRFSNFGEFQSHWAKRMATWKEGKGGQFTPLTFQISEFRGDKSAGQTTSHIDYTVRVFVRGQESAKPIATYADEARRRSGAPTGCGISTRESWQSAGR